MAIIILNILDARTADVLTPQNPYRRRADHRRRADSPTSPPPLPTSPPDLPSRPPLPTSPLQLPSLPHCTPLLPSSPNTRGRSASRKNNPEPDQERERKNGGRGGVLGRRARGGALERAACRRGVLGRRHSRELQTKPRGADTPPTKGAKTCSSVTEKEIRQKAKEAGPSAETPREPQTPEQNGDVTPTEEDWFSAESDGDEARCEEKRVQRTAIDQPDPRLDGLAVILDKLANEPNDDPLEALMRGEELGRILGSAQPFCKRPKFPCPSAGPGSQQEPLGACTEEIDTVLVTASNKQQIARCAVKIGPAAITMLTDSDSSRNCLDRRAHKRPRKRDPQVVSEEYEGGTVTLGASSMPPGSSGTPTGCFGPRIERGGRTWSRRAHGCAWSRRP